MARSGGTDVGCSEFGRKHRKPFRGLPGVDRASGLYRGGDTRVLIVDPAHLMAASHGHGPRHVLFLVTVSSLLSYTVGITVTASLDHASPSASRSAIPQPSSATHDRSPRQDDQRRGRHLLVGHLRRRQHHRDRLHQRHDRGRHPHPHAQPLSLIYTHSHILCSPSSSAPSRSAPAAARS